MDREEEFEISLLKELAWTLFCYTAAASGFIWTKNQPINVRQGTAGEMGGKPVSAPLSLLINDGRFPSGPATSIPHQCWHPYVFKIPLLICVLILETVVVRNLVRMSYRYLHSVVVPKVLHFLSLLRNILVLVLSLILFLMANYAMTSADSICAQQLHPGGTVGILNNDNVGVAAGEETLFWTISSVFVRTAQFIMVIFWMDHWGSKLNLAILLFRDRQRQINEDNINILAINEHRAIMGG